MYVRLFEKLLSGNVKFLILGGAAVSLHGFPRMTTDIDIILENSPDNIARFITAVSHWGDGCAAGLGYDDFQGPGCVRIDEDFPLDVFTLLNGKPYEHFADNAAKYSLGEGLEVRCISVSDLIDLKKGIFREKDQLDVTVLRRLLVSPPQSSPPAINLQAPPVPDEGTPPAREPKGPDSPPNPA